MTADVVNVALRRNLGGQQASCGGVTVAWRTMLYSPWLPISETVTADDGVLTSLPMLLTSCGVTCV